MKEGHERNPKDSTFFELDVEAGVDKRINGVPSLFDVEFDLVLRNVFEICLIAFLIWPKIQVWGRGYFFLKLHFDHQ